jgi:predicted nucleotidyltransferase
MDLTSLGNGHTRLYSGGVLRLNDLAHQLGADERTLRRAVTDGTIRCEHLGPRKRYVSDEERRYMVSHWPMLADLRRALRTEPNVRLAVLYGSLARGDEDADSDLDLLVSFADDRPDAAVKLAVRLERTLGRDVDVARLNRVKDSAPLLLLQALDEGRVVLDRDVQWEQLHAQRANIARRARRSHAARRRRARISINELLATEQIVERHVG